MTYQIGQKVTAQTNYKTHQVAGGGGKAYDMGKGTWGVVKDVRGDWVDVDYGKGSGGGTGWVHRSAFEAPKAPAVKPSQQAAQQQAMATPASAQPSESQKQLTAYLKDIQSRAAQLAEREDTFFDSISKQNQQLMEFVNSNEMPEQIDYAAQWQEMRQEHGVMELEQNLNVLKDQQRALEAEMYNEGMQTMNGIGNRSVAMGRLSERQMQLQMQMDFIGRQQSRVVDQLNSANGVIGMMMQFAQQSYQDAVQAYNTELSTRMQLHSTFTSQATAFMQMANSERTQLQGQALDLQTKFVEWEREDIKQQQTMALAHIEMYSNMVTAGNLKWENMDAQQRVNIGKLELQAGLPQGFISSLRSNREVEGNKMVTTITRESGGNKYADIIWQRPDGSIYTETRHTGTVPASESETGYTQSERIAAINAEFETRGKDGYVSHERFNAARKAWVAMEGKPEDFDRLYKHRANPGDEDGSWYKYYGL